MLVVNYVSLEIKIIAVNTVSLEWKVSISPQQDLT